ncbi:hypothetical protein MIND_01247500 [Mycena indigotica]|uniref:Uncharacterized protein n=1 Tax=Mycena indigotica TaxID=2126181 RepID=A0A8H6VSC3_9AGAR|nr:uncharacterized protein MIND_01247500 [Mycena indigotica]KAF7292202.1 hypothetical protein MIND_01247500 [Mycena indigotica]
MASLPARTGSIYHLPPLALPSCPHRIANVAVSDFGLTSLTPPTPCLPLRSPPALSSARAESPPTHAERSSSSDSAKPLLAARVDHATLPCDADVSTTYSTLRVILLLGHPRDLLRSCCADCLCGSTSSTQPSCSLPYRPSRPSLPTTIAALSCVDRHLLCP